MELVDRPGRPLIGMEQFVEGVFEKHNNNVGGTVSDRESERATPNAFSHFNYAITRYDRESERATPNAFSHFTWHASNNTILVCDIQGVMDDYTDPQIHTLSGKGFGKGNLGQVVNP
ncbi:kinase-like domain-containing protein [Baffinella frigidus]|nr:kinase-like domain-containing protein [Cryptophyta sp. CCMP2293]